MLFNIYKWSIHILCTYVCFSSAKLTDRAAAGIIATRYDDDIIIIIIIIKLK